ncbi:DNA transformation protein [Vibrio sp. 10N.286.49.B3]|uniref:TfoX/Sxy family DNA transformation protein n=1 Tax=Vibrio sp. 10N.286.49.B3 TaxID=1880855 RepID=UPI000C84407D|nr:TfoX/Sxy family DNA transformation protein [Vibrio sp. 10N.286.49.B3]PMH44961.1 DNA transformation protein [Vibrio sp. 10N.286.49.B3]
MDKPILKDTMRLFEQLGSIKSRSMFGGFGIFVDDTMFALVVKNKLHIRADKATENAFRQQQLQPYTYQKKGFPVVTKYFALPDEYWQTPEKIMAAAQHSLKVARQDKEVKSTTKPTRLKDLPNLRLATERMLKKAGIESVEDLHQQGAAEAFKAIQQSQAMNPNLELLWALEGAIKGQHWSIVPQQRRDELISHIN